MLSEFEHNLIKRIGNKEQLTNDDLNTLYYNLVNKYEGKHFINDESSKFAWMLITHFILQDTYYIYQYPIGTCISLYIVNGIINNKDNMVEKYLKFLTLGNSVNIIDSLKILGIDVRSSDYINFGLNYLTNKINDFSKLFQ